MPVSPANLPMDGSTTPAGYGLTGDRSPCHQDDGKRRAWSEMSAGYAVDLDECTSWQEYEAAASAQWMRRYRDAAQEAQRRINEDPDAYLRSRQQRAAKRRWESGEPEEQVQRSQTPPGVAQELSRRPVKISPRSVFHSGLLARNMSSADGVSRQRRINQWLSHSAAIVNDDPLGEATPQSGGRHKSRWDKGRQVLNRLRHKRRGSAVSHES